MMPSCLLRGLPSCSALRLMAPTLALLMVAPSLDAQEATSASDPGVDVIEITFDREPVEDGITFKEKDAKPGATQESKGDKGQVATRVVKDGNIPGQTWMRRMLFKVTDERFQNGQRPAVDVEVRYALDTWAGVEFKADTALGEQKVSSGWGGAPYLRTERFQIDNAHFGGGIADGYDLSVAGANAPLHVRSVRITGYNPTENVRWDRMLRIGKVTGDRPGGVLAFPRQADQSVLVNLRNLAFVDRPITYRLIIRDLDGKVMSEQADTITLTQSEERDLTLDFDPSDWPLGPYTANLTLRLDESSDPVLDRQLRLGIISDTAIAKARDDEFFYGLDAANNHSKDTGDAVSLVWYDLMGVDILRSLPAKAPYDSENIADAIETIQRANLRSGIMMDPAKPDDGDAKRQDKLMRDRTKQLVDAVAQHGGDGPGQVHFIELGNEPDLPFFWQGSIASYIERMEPMAAAIHEAMATAGLERGEDVYVMNGGLSFAGPEGDKRSREFMQQFDPKTLDAIAYHGHGAGIQAERSAYERGLAAAADGGASGLPLIETESGYAGTNEAGLIEQARTAVEKLTYSQSVGQPFFIYFRLYMDGDGPYGMTQNRVEPMPSVLSYRHMVERLRHHRFQSQLEMPQGLRDAGIIAYDFAETDGAGEPTGRRTIVAWTEKPASRDLLIEVPGASDVTRYDLFGNEMEVAQAGPDRVRMAVDVTPSYLTWMASGGSAGPSVGESLLAVDGADRVLTGSGNVVRVNVTNPSEQAATLRLDASADARLSADVTPTTQTFTVPAGETAEAEVQLGLGDAAAPLDMPSWWAVFIDADHEKIEGKQWMSMPDTLRSVSGSAVEPVYVATDDGRIDIGALSSGLREKRPAVGFATLDSPSATTLPVAASADWWMAWYVNGERVYSTLDKGNQHGGFADHTFDLPLKQGRNVIAFVVQSGSAGWAIDMAGPAERRLALEPDRPLDRLTLGLFDGDRELASLNAPLQLVGPVPPLGDVAADAPLGEWINLQPFATASDEAVTNFFVEQPEQSKWYKGEADLSAVVWLRRDGDTVHLVVAARDDRHEAASGAQGDRLDVLFADADGKPLMEATLPSSSGGKVERLEKSALGPVTLYRLAVPADRLQGSGTTLNLRLHDRDGGEEKQVLDLGDVESPTGGLRLGL